MLFLHLQESEFFDPISSCFVELPEKHVTLEHSLLAVAEWESKWKKPFFSAEKTQEETLDYIRCMSNGGLTADDIKRLNESHFSSINRYIEDPMTATTFQSANHSGGGRKKQVVTSEEIYYLMAANGIPFSCESWNLNRLMVLIRICQIRSSPQKKMNRRDLLRQQSALNEARKSKYKH